MQKVKTQGMLLKSCFVPAVCQPANDDAISRTADKESDIPNPKPKEEATLEEEENFIKEHNMEEDELELEYEDSSDDDNGRNISSKG